MAPPMSRKPRLIKLLTWRLFAVATVVLTILCGVWIHTEIQDFEDAATHMRDDMLAERRALLRTVVQQAVEGIDFRRRQVDTRVHGTLKKRVDEAVSIVQSMWDVGAATYPRGTLEDLIQAALGDVRFDGGRGYFFAFDENLQLELLPDVMAKEARASPSGQMPRGMELARRIKAAVDAGGGGAFYSYQWVRPDRDGSSRDYRKIAYVRLIKPLGWYIGTGEYLEDIEHDVQVETLEWLRSIRYGDDGGGYIFAADWSGQALLGPGAGHNVLDVEDANGFKVVRALIAAARDGGGFVDYVQPSVADSKGYRTERKLGYVLPVRNWNWYVGGGLYVDDVERDIAAARAALEKRIRSSLIQGILLFAVLGVATWWFSRRIARGLAGDVAAFERFFASDGRHGQDLVPERMRSRELDHLARAALAMARSRDTAETVLAERTRQLERSNEDLERFAWIASHDLQEPLRTVASFLQLLERKMGPRLDAEEAEYMGYAVQGARRMRLQIQALMAYARQQDDAVEVTAVPVGEVVDEVLQVFADDMAAFSVQVEIDDLPVVKANRPLITTVFQNLVSNALKFREPERPLRLHVSAEATPLDGCPAWRIKVADNGSGLPRAYRDEAFLLLRRMHGPAVSGTGVGLAMVKKLVEAQGGQVGMDDGLDGYGVTVWFTFPEAETEAGVGGEVPA